KSLGFVLVLGYVWWARQRPLGIGLHSRRLGPAVTIGAGITILAFMVAVVVQVITLPSGASLDLAPIDPKRGGLAVPDSPPFSSLGTWSTASWRRACSGASC